MFNNQELKQTEETKASYRKRCERLLFRYVRETGVDFEFIYPPEFIDWLIELAQGWEKSTFRQYKAAVILALPSFEICTFDMDESLEKLKDTSQDICKGSPSGRTSHNKKKSYPPEILDRLFEEFVSKPTKYRYALELSTILIGTITLGLRPVEWGQSEFILDQETGEKALLVQNAKATNGRANGPSRTIIYGHLPKKIQNAISYLVKFAGNSENWMVEYNRISDLHYRLQKKLRPRAKRKYAIYSARHQCIANLKQAGVFERIAALVGHGTTRTAAEHYGRATAGRMKMSAVIDYEINAETLPRPGRNKGDEKKIKDNRRGYEQRLLGSQGPKI
ncbi:MAG: hypothetical protein COB46_08130 [Rhodospirillaceae bacterium]|nr:MAG: hypothetical protein COB46_08130 [Rhodospirillaceae bacterium]